MNSINAETRQKLTGMVRALEFSHYAADQASDDEWIVKATYARSETAGCFDAAISIVPRNPLLQAPFGLAVDIHSADNPAARRSSSTNILGQAWFSGLPPGVYSAQLAEDSTETAASQTNTAAEEMTTKQSESAEPIPAPAPLADAAPSEPASRGDDASRQGSSSTPDSQKRPATSVHDSSPSLKRGVARRWMNSRSIAGLTAGALLILLGVGLMVHRDENSFYHHTLTAMSEPVLRLSEARLHAMGGGSVDTTAARQYSPRKIKISSRDEGEIEVPYVRLPLQFEGSNQDSMDSNSLLLLDDLAKVIQQLRKSGEEIHIEFHLLQEDTSDSRALLMRRATALDDLLKKRGVDINIVPFDNRDHAQIREANGLPPEAPMVILLVREG